MALPDADSAEGRVGLAAVESLRRRLLVAMPGADRNTFAAGGAAAAQYRCATIGLHARAEAVRLDALAPVGLECALGHGRCAPVSLE